MPVSIRQLEILHAVLQEGTMSGAARRLRVSQPAISRGVAAAEQALRVRLFERRGTTLEATPEAEELRGALEPIFQQIAGALDLAEQLRFGAGRLIHVAASPSFAFDPLPRAVPLFRRDFPEAQVIARVRDAAAIKAGILTREFDLGLIYNERWFGPMTSVPICEAEIHALMPEGHPLAARETVTPHDLAGLPLISFSRSSAIGLDLDRLFQEAGRPPRQLAVSVGNSHMAARFVAAGAGIGLTDPFVLGTPMEAGLVGRPFRPSRRLVPQVVWAQDRRLGPPERRMIEALRTAGAEWAARFDVGPARRSPG